MTTKTTFSCGDALDIVHAIALHGRLLKSLAKSSTIELKASKVEKADTAGLQLMISLSEEIKKTGGNLIWKNPSPALIKAAKLLGVSQQLKLN